MSTWVRREYTGIGVTQHRPGPYLAAVQDPYQGKVLLCIDVSGSMASRAGLHSRLDEAKRGARQFVDEALAAHYRVGLVLWHHGIEAFVPLSADAGRLGKVLRSAGADGGNDIVPTLELGIREMGALTGDRVIAVFGDGDLGPAGPALSAAREVARHGIRIVTRGLGRASAEELAKIETDGAPAEVIESGDIAAGIAAMAKAIIRR